MKKEELLAAGVPTESIKAVQTLHGKDLERERRKAVEKQREEDVVLPALRGAIIKLLYVLPKVGLEELLGFAYDLLVEKETTKNEITKE